MLRSLFFAASLIAAASVGAREPVVQVDEAVMTDESLFDIDMNSEDICDSISPPKQCKDMGQGQQIQ